MRKTIGILIIIITFLVQIVLFYLLIANYQLFDNYNLNKNFTLTSLYLLVPIFIGVKLLSPKKAIDDIPKTELNYKLENENLRKISQRIIVTLPINVFGIWSFINLLICWIYNRSNLMAGITIDIILISINILALIVISFRLKFFFKNKTIDYNFHYGKIKITNGIKEHNCDMEKLIFLFKYDRYFVCIEDGYRTMLIIPMKQ